MTWKPSTEPGKPTAARTSAGFPFTVTTTGEFTAAGVSDGNGWPGSTPGRTGPRPVAKRDKISPAAAGFNAVTSVKSVGGTTAGPLGCEAVWGGTRGSSQ